MAAAAAGSPADVETLMHMNQDKLRMLKVCGQKGPAQMGSLFSMARGLEKMKLASLVMGM